MSIRYARDGLKIVRVVEDAPRLSPEAIEAAARSDDRSRRLRAFTAGILADARRSGVAAAVTAKYPGAAIRLARVRTGRSQRQLALELGMSRSMLAACEAGDRIVPYELARWAAQALAGEGKAR